MIHKPEILIFREKLLGSSETFIKAQADQLQEFKVLFMGLRSINGLELNQESYLLDKRQNLLGKGKEGLYKLFGHGFDVTRKLKKKNIKLIHAHFGPDGVFALPVAKALRVPLMVTFHGYDITTKDEHLKEHLSHRLYLNRRKELQRKGDQFIAVSHFIKDQLILKGFPEEKIIQHYIGVDTDFFTADQTTNRKPMVLFVGRLVENKGAEYLIHAMSKVQKIRSEAELVIVGDGPLRSYLEDLAFRNLTNYRFLGIQSQSVIKSLLNVAKVFSVPSVTIENGNSEGFGMVFAEANAMGVPVVSFATGGIPEAVSHGETGLLVPEKDIDGLSENLLRLLMDSDLWDTYSKRGEERVRELFDLKKQNRILEDIYKSLIKHT